MSPSVPDKKLPVPASYNTKSLFSVSVATINRLPSTVSEETVVWQWEVILLSVILLSSAPVITVEGLRVKFKESPPLSPLFWYFSFLLISSPLFNCHSFVSTSLHWVPLFDCSVICMLVFISCLVSLICTSLELLIQSRWSSSCPLFFSQISSPMCLRSLAELPLSHCLSVFFLPGCTGKVCPCGGFYDLIR